MAETMKNLDVDLRKEKLSCERHCYKSSTELVNWSQTSSCYARFAPCGLQNEQYRRLRNRIAGLMPANLFIRPKLYLKLGALAVRMTH